MEVEGDPPKSILSPTLESFEAFIGAYVKYIPEKIQVEKRIREIQEYSKNKRVRKDIPKSPEKVLPIEMKLLWLDTLGLHVGRNEMAGKRLFRRAKTLHKEEERSVQRSTRRS